MEAAKKVFEGSTASEAANWAYIAEGALNLTCGYVGSEDALRGCVLRVRKRNEEATGGKESDSNPWSESLRFIESKVVPWLGSRYVHRSMPVDFPDGFIEALAAKIEGARPVKRRKHSLDFSVQTGLLMVNNTIIPEGKVGEPTVCFELKVKWGFLPSSPFITHEIKKTVDRFTLHQKLKNTKQKVDSLSNYNPLDLFSFEPERIMKALRGLVETPQNNFRMFIDGKMIYPDENGKGSPEDFAELLPQSLVSVDTVLETLCEILSREPLLHRIKSMQELDDCDIEGVWPVYQQVLARNETIQPLDDKEIIEKRPRPSTLPEDKESQHDLIRRFLLSATAKDCSVMIAMKPAGDLISEETQESPPSKDAPVEVEQMDRVLSREKDILYTIAIVDLDPKPIEKMQHWFDVDQEIAKSYSKEEGKKLT